MVSRDFRSASFRVSNSSLGEPYIVSKGTGVKVKRFSKFIRDEHGAELAEYAVGTAILVAVAIIVYKVLGNAVNIKMNTTANEIKS